MPSTIRLLALTPHGEEEITHLNTGVNSIGREPENAVVVDSSAVSRRHGCVIEAGTQWVFRDLGSTNGSRLNGVKVSADQMRILRSGDVIGIADFQMRVEELPPPGRLTDSQRLMRGVGNISLLVFADEKFVEEFSIRTQGGTFIVGGPGSNLALTGEYNDERQLLIQLADNRLELVAGTGSLPVIVNGNVVVGPSTLVDRDEVAIGYYHILVNFSASDPELEQRQSRVERSAAEEVSMSPAVNAYDRPHVPEHLKPADTDGWEVEASRRKMAQKKFVFGTDPEAENVGSTLSMGANDFATRVGFEMNPSQRFASATFSEEDTTRALSGKFLGRLLFIIVIIVLVITGILLSIFLK